MKCIKIIKRTLLTLICLIIMSNIGVASAAPNGLVYLGNVNGDFDIYTTAISVNGFFDKYNYRTSGGSWKLYIIQVVRNEALRKRVVDSLNSRPIIWHPTSSGSKRLGAIGNEMLYNAKEDALDVGVPSLIYNDQWELAGEENCAEYFQPFSLKGKTESDNYRKLQILVNAYLDNEVEKHPNGGGGWQ